MQSAKALDAKVTKDHRVGPPRCAPRRDLVATAQEAYIEQTFAETGKATYANTVSKLAVNLSSGVTVRLRANGNGWSARATHERVRGTRCSVYRGTIKPFPPATEEGRIDCD